MKKTLIVIDMQNDFIDGSLGTDEAVKIVPNVRKKIEEYRSNSDEIIFTRDTHGEDYLNTPEGKKLPVVHCVKNTHGWQIADGLDVTDAIHIDTFEQKTGSSFYGAFYQCFEKVYFSFEVGMRKPDAEIYLHVLQQNDLSPKRTLFVDDKKENTDAAQALGLQVWNLQVGKEDVVDLFEKNNLG